MSRTQEISTGVKAVGAGIGEARVQAEETLEFAREQIEFAYSHGWDGIAQSMTMTSELLESVTEQLGSAETSCERAHTTLDQIHDTMSLQDVEQHLNATLTELDAANTTLDGTILLLDEAIQSAEQAEHESLTARLHHLRTQMEELFGQLAQTRTDTDIERQEAEDLGQQTQAAGSPGNCSRVAEEDPPHRHPHHRPAPKQRRPAGPIPWNVRTGWISGSLMLRTPNLSPARKDGRASSVR